MMVRYWFMHMKQGSKGPDFVEELWEQGLAGVLFGTWKLEVVQRADGSIDKDRLDARYIRERSPQPPSFDFTGGFLNGARTFLCEVSEDDRVVVFYNKALHIGRVGAGYREDPDEKPSRGEHGERFKCRPIEDSKEFSLAWLPASYRLVPGMGRRAIQSIKTYRPLVQILDQCASEQQVRDKFREMSGVELLEMLSPKQWEVLCAEYLRAERGFRPLLLAIGDTLRQIDLYGVDVTGRRILAQCKNSSKELNVKSVVQWEEELGKRDEDTLFYFARSGIKDSERPSASSLRSTIRTGEDILRWLERDPDYEGYLRTL